MNESSLIRGQMMGDILERRPSRHKTRDVRSVALRTLEFLAVMSGVLVIGLIDAVTGADIHVISLYFVPLIFASRRFRKTGAVVTALLCTLVWLAAYYYTAGHHLEPYIWIVNFFTQGTVFITVSLLIAELSRALQIERTRSRVDQLTGLKNRRAFIEVANVALALCKRRSQPVSLAFLDLDNFKCANDTFGHDHGDALLQECSTIIAASLRASDVAARIGGDEFVIFLPETDGNAARTLIERLRKALDNATRLRSSGVTASIGVIVDETAMSPLEDMLKRADARMYQMKRFNKRAARTRHLEERARQCFP